MDFDCSLFYSDSIRSGLDNEGNYALVESVHGVDISISISNSPSNQNIH